MNEFIRFYEFIRDNYYGDGGYDPNHCYSYLNQFPRETTTFYNNRKRDSNLENLFRPLQDLFLEPILSSSIDFKTQNKPLNYIIEQTKLFYSSGDSLVDFKLYMKCVFSVQTDLLADGTPDIQTLPTIDKVFPADIKELNMVGLVVKDAKYFEYKMIDNVKVPVFVEYSDNLFSKKTMAWRDGSKKVCLVDQGESKRITDFDGYKYGTLDKIGLKLDDKPRTFDLAKIQKQLYQLDTQRLNTLKKDGYPILMIQTNDDLDAISLSQDTIIKIPADDNIKHTPQYLEAQLEGVSLTTEIIEEKKSTIYKVFTNGLFSDNIKYSSTMSSIIATKSFKNSIDSLYKIYKDINKTMIDNIIFIYGLNTTYTIDYTDIELTEETLKTEAEKILQ
jgi:hypothetical protein